MSLVSGSSHENSRPVIMEMTSAKPKIRHVFVFTCLTERKIGALSSVISPRFRIDFHYQYRNLIPIFKESDWLVQ